MFSTIKPDRRWSDIGLKALIASIVAAFALSILDGIWRGQIAAGHISSDSRGISEMVTSWIYNFRIIAEQGFYAATIFFVGAKFFETRTVFTVGFDRIDADKILLKGPDEQNVVWVGHRYATPLEAQAVAEAFAERLRQSSK
jgi:hypothetical protein